MKFTKLIILAVALVAVLAVTRYLVFPPAVTPPPPPPAATERTDIQLTVSAAGLKFTGASGHHGNCDTSNSPYCVKVEQGDNAEITFRLVGFNNWGFSRMQLVAEPSDKLDFGTQGDFSQEMQDDFYVTINGVDIHPDTNGIIDLDGPPGVDKNFTLIDKNDFRQTYKYQLEACEINEDDDDDDDDNDNCHRSDPMIENEG